MGVPSEIFARFLDRREPCRFLRSSTGAESLSSDRILARAKACARLLRAWGVRRGERVAIDLPLGPELMVALFGAWGCGAAACLLPPVEGARGQAAHQLSQVLDSVAPAAVISASPAAVAMLASRPPACVLDRSALSALEDPPGGFPELPTSDDDAIIQLTSGSTGRPKAVSLRHGQFDANCSGISERCATSPQDHMVSWLPAHHDMGLSAITQAIWSGAGLTLIGTDLFVRAPWVWPEAIATSRGTTSPAPAFAFSLLARYAPRLRRTRPDLSSWRYAWVGAEPVFERTLEDFAGAMEPFGFDSASLKPAYGMAEAVVAVSCTPADRPRNVIHVDGDALRSRGAVIPGRPGDAGVVPVVSNGAPIQGIRLRIMDPDGGLLGAGRQGRIQIAGPSVAGGYLDGVEAERFLDGGWFDTGDLGFLVDGELYVSGRSKDVIIRGGANISPHAIESEVERAIGLRPGQVAAFSHINVAEAREEIVVVLARAASATVPGSLRAEVAQCASRNLGIQVDVVAFAGKDRIPRTTSGKVQRGLARQMYLEGKFSTEESTHEG